MKQTNKPLIILTAGGTGGHVYPAEALAEELSLRGYRLMLITDKRGLNNYKGKLSEIQNCAVLSGALVGKSKLFKIKSLIKTSIGIIQAAFILIKEKPAAVVGFGGYASFPACMAAILLGKKLIIHEQNSVMSRTNRFLAKHASLVAKSFENTKYIPQNKPVVHSGMPVRDAIVKLYGSNYNFNSNIFKIFILGGSQGAKIFSEILPNAIVGLDKDVLSKLEIIQQCRKEDIEEVENIYAKANIKHKVSSFFSNMAELYNCTNLIISRAGASSVCEIAIAGIPSILVPLPTAADDHQTGNARDLEIAGGAILIAQNDFSVQNIRLIISELINNPQKLETMSKNTINKAIPNAANKLADAVEKIICY